MNKQNINGILLVVGALLIGYGFFKPDLSNFIPNKSVVVDNSIVVGPPSDPTIKEACKAVIDALQNANKNDCLKLASLYYDLSQLILLDGNDQVVKSTLEIREANKLAGLFFRLNLKDKYENLAEALNGVVVSGIGDDDVVLDETTRAKAVDVFKALSWACSEGAK